MSPPLIIIPARQGSVGLPCKNRRHWDALRQTVAALDWPSVTVTDDPWIANRAPHEVYWLYMNGAHTVAAAVQVVLQTRAQAADGPIVILQPSSPTTRRVDYVRTAVDHLQAYPDHSSVTSVVPWTGEPPAKAVYLTDHGHLIPPTTHESRHQQPRAYRRDGTVYAVRPEYAQHGDLYGPAPIPLLIDPADSVTLD